MANYQAIFADRTVTTAVLNSLIVATSTTALSVDPRDAGGVRVARFEFRGKADLWFWFISNRMISPIVLALPVYPLRARSGC